MSLIRRRSFLFGLVAGICAPAIVRAASLMPVKTVLWTPEPAIIQPRVLVLGVPRCDVCSGPFGMCSHTGGPMQMNIYDMRLDSRIVENLQIDQHDYALMRKLNT